jgi:hypothetical protein
MAVDSRQTQFVNTFMDQVMTRVRGEVDARFRGFFEFRQEAERTCKLYYIRTVPSISTHDHVSTMSFFGSFVPSYPTEYIFGFYFNSGSDIERSIHEHLFTHVLRVEFDRTDSAGNRVGRIPVGNWEFFKHQVVLFGSGNYAIRFCPGPDPEVDKISEDRHLGLINDVVFPFFQTVLAVYEERATPAARGGAGVVGCEESHIVSVLENLHARLTLLETKCFR